MDACGPESLGSALAPLLVQSQASTAWRAPFEFELPSLPERGALCVGFLIAWAHAAHLQQHAGRLTSPGEHAHAARFVRPEDALRHLVGRALLRRLAIRCARADGAAELDTNSWGKPVFAGGALDGSISHAGTQVWAAVTGAGAIGIDVEAQAALGDASDLLASLHPQEAAHIAASREPRASALRCWTRKEAVAKATGLGLSLPLQAYAVACDAHASDWLRCAPPGTTLDDWTTVDLPVGSGYAGALAVHGGCAQVQAVRVTPAWS